MLLTKTVLGILILVACLVWYAWVNSKLRARETRHGFSGRKVPPQDVLLGEDAKRVYTISKDYRIKYCRQVYVNIPFELRVAFAEPGSLKEKEPELIVRDGHIKFEVPEEEPTVKVELVFADGSFEANETTQEKPLKKDRETVFSFWLKPLKSEDCLLTVTISYAALEEVAEKVEQIQVSTVQETGGQQTTTTFVKKPATTQTAYRELDQVTLNVSVVSFLGLNAWELNFLGRGLGALITLLIVGISYATGRNFDWIEALEFLILGVATPLGISMYDGLKGSLKPPEPEKS